MKEKRDIKEKMTAGFIVVLIKMSISTDCFIR